MARPTLEVAEIFRRYGETCRAGALGGHVEQCDACGHQRIAYNSCENRHCSTCQSLKRAAWVDDRKEDLLDVEYFHVVFTVPQDVAAIAVQNKATVYNLLFRATAETLRIIASWNCSLSFLLRASCTIEM